MPAVCGSSPPLTEQPASGLTREHAQHGLHRHLVAAIIHLHVLAVQVQRPARLGPHVAGAAVARIARGVVGQHEDDVAVGDAETLDGAVHAQRVGHVLPHACQSAAVALALLRSAQQLTR